MTDIAAADDNFFAYRSVTCAEINPIMITASRRDIYLLRPRETRPHRLDVAGRRRFVTELQQRRSIQPFIN